MFQLARVLKPDGQMICTEALGHNPLISLYRKRTPHLRTKWEVKHVLRKELFAEMAKYFDGIEMHFFHLTTLAGVPFRKLPGFELILRALERVDAVLLKLPFFRWQAWQAFFILSKPKKSLFTN